MSDQGIPIPASVVTAVGRLFVENVLMEEELSRQRSGPTIVDDDEGGSGVREPRSPSPDAPGGVTTP